MRLEGVQFKTGQDWQEEYRLGERAEDLSPESVYKGILERFCRDCMRDFCREKNKAVGQVVAEFITAGQLVLREKHSAIALTAEEVTKRAIWRVKDSEEDWMSSSLLSPSFPFSM